jgi:hypothetical protein
MQGVNNINELRNLSLRLIDDIIGEKYKLVGEPSETEHKVLDHVNKQIANVINITNMEMKYAKDNNETIKFLEYESR